MLCTSRRLRAESLLVAAVAASLVAVPATAEAAGATATVSSVSPLHVRATPALTAKAVGILKNKQKVVIACYVKGTTMVRGTVRTSNLWDKIGTGKYISHAYVKSTKAVAACAPVASSAAVTTAPVKVSASKYIIGTVKSADGQVKIRAAATSSAKQISSAANGAKLSLVCGVVGSKVVGTVRTTTQWDRLSNGNYISHAYVITPTLKLCAATSTTIKSTVAQTPAKFIAAAVAAAQLGWRQYGVPASVTIAQSILESGWGSSGLSSVDNNYFGIKCQNGEHGTIANGCHAYQTQECSKAGVCATTTATFRTYASETNSFRDHGSFLKSNSRYKAAFSYTRNANLFIWNVAKAGYATDPNYFTKVTGVMAAYNLYQYDTWK